MRILILANNDAGLYKVRKELIERLMLLSNEIYISLPNGDFVKSLEQMGSHFIDTPIDRRGMSMAKDLKLFLKYKQILRSVSPELVITYTIKPNIYGGIAARFRKIEYAANITGLGSAFENSGLLRKFVVYLYRIALKRAKVVFFENLNNREEFLKYHICNSDKSCLLNGAGVNTLAYKYLNYPNNSYNTKFLFVGRVMREKGVDELLEAMRMLRKEGHHCLLDIVGPFEEDYREKLDNFEKEGWLKYHGFQRDVIPFIANSHCFVLPSYHEGMANTNLECASCGRPIITSNIPGCREAVIDGKTGLLCEPKNVESLYTAMKAIVAMSNSDREIMGKEGRKYIQSDFNKEEIVNITIKHLIG